MRESDRDRSQERRRRRWGGEGIGRADRASGGREREILNL